MNSMPLLRVKILSQPAEAAHPSDKGLELAWTLPGRYEGVAANGSNLFAIDAHGHCTVVDAAGKQTGAFTTDAETGGMLRAAHLAGPESNDLICFESWGPDVRAIDEKGAKLWTYMGGEGVDDVHPVDLRGDGKMEVVVGYNGGTGLHVLDEHGHLLWKCTKLSNVSHVDGGDLRGSGAGSVVSTSAEGEVHLFSADGKQEPDLSPGMYADFVRFIPAKKGAQGKIIAGGSLGGHESLVAIDPDGKKLWEAAVSEGKGHVDSAAVAPGRPWIAAGMRGGRLLVLDTETGKVIAETSGQEAKLEVAWMSTDSGLLLIATGRDRLHAYKITAE